MRSYTLYCALQGIKPPMPATIASLAGWIADLSIKRVKAKTIKAYLTGVRSSHIDLGYENLTVFHHPQLQRIIAGSRRLHGEAGTKERLPLTRDVLLRLLQRLKQSDRYQATLYAAFCLAFGAFLRMGEFTYSTRDRQQEDFDQWFLTRRSVRFHDDHIELTLPASKTDPFRQGVTLTIAASSDDACAVKALNHLFKRWPAPPDAPLFEDTVSGDFNRDSVIHMLRQLLRQIGVEGHYSGHSFRRGAATSAKEAGLSDDEIQLLGRWKSDAYRLYVTYHPARILAISRRHQHSTPSR